jgi:KUP system potassium uptake protein
MSKNESGPSSRAALMLGALGIVYGDIGTSPLYALRECFLPSQGLVVNHDNVLGVLSLIIWTLITLVCVKYLAFVMRAGNHGEGGILSLLALALPDRQKPGRTTAWLLGLGIFGAGLLYGDGIITPSLTVLSAVEGLTVVTDTFNPYVAPISVVILIGLFAIQRHGTRKVGNAFGPVMVLWFLVLAALGLRGILLNPEVRGCGFCLVAAGLDLSCWDRCSSRSPAARRCTRIWGISGPAPSAARGLGWCCPHSS